MSEPIQIVCGLDVLGLASIPKGLKAIADRGMLPIRSTRQYEIWQASSEKDFSALIQTKSGLVTYRPEDLNSAQHLLDWLSNQVRITDRHVRALLLLDAADAGLRGLATRRPEQSQFLDAWGGEMLRHHLDEIEEPYLDRPDLRADILAATGGIPSEVVRLVDSIRFEAPHNSISGWEIKEAFPEGLMNSNLVATLLLIEEDFASLEQYRALDEMIREEIGVDLTTIGPDLEATGLITRWYPDVCQSQSKMGPCRGVKMGHFG